MATRNAMRRRAFLLGNGSSAHMSTALFKAMGAEPVGSTPEEFKAVIDRDIAKWKPLAQKVGIKVD